MDSKVDRASSVVLYVHGILGAPDYFDFLRKMLPTGWDERCLLLEGHGGTPRDFSRASMSRWKLQVSDMISELCSHYSTVVVAAHSMGTLFAINEAAKGKVSGLFLLNPPLRLRLTRRLFTTPLLMKLGVRSNRWVQAASAAYSISNGGSILDYLRWIPRYLELFAEIRRVGSIESIGGVPARVYLSARDEMVSLHAGRYFERYNNVVVTTLNHSGHYLYDEADRHSVQEDFRKFLSEFTQ